MKVSSALKWTLVYRFLATVSFGLGLCIALVGLWFALVPALEAFAENVTEPDVFSTALEAARLSGFLLVVVGVLVWQFGSTLAYFWTFGSALEASVADVATTDAHRQETAGSDRSRPIGTVDRTADTPGRGGATETPEHDGATGTPGRDEATGPSGPGRTTGTRGQEGRAERSTEGGGAPPGDARTGRNVEDGVARADTELREETAGGGIVQADTEVREGNVEARDDADTAGEPEAGGDRNDEELGDTGDECTREDPRDPDRTGN